MSGSPRAPRILDHGEVHLWRADLDVHSDRADLLEFLCTPDEQRRALDMVDDERRARFVARKGLLRLLLGDYAQRLTPGHELLSSSAYANGFALFAIGRTSRLGLGLAPVRAHAAPPIGVASAAEALWMSDSDDRARRVALFVAAREAAGRAHHDLRDDSLLTGLSLLGSGVGPVPFGDTRLVLQVVRMEQAVGCVVHDGPPLPSLLRVLGA